MRRGVPVEARNPSSETPRFAEQSIGLVDYFIVSYILKEEYMEEIKNKSSLRLYFRFYTSFSSIDWKYFTLNYEDYRCEKYGCNYYKLTNNPELLEFIRFLLDKKHIVDFDSRSGQSCWLKVDGKKCRLLRDDIEIGKEFQTTERIHDYFDEKYFLTIRKGSYNV